MTRILSLSIAALALAGSACIAPMEGRMWSGYQASYDGAPSAGPSAGPFAKDPTDSPIYDWNGGVVDSNPPGEVVQGAPARDVEPTGEGRVYILELYQAAVDERDALQLEVIALERAFQQSQGELTDALARLEEQSRQLEGLAAERDRVRGENEDLTARLVTAQIRRLEAEKVLIESKLEWYRTDPNKSASKTFETKTSASKPAASSKEKP